jgi:hypothetical protein
MLRRRRGIGWGLKREEEERMEGGMEDVGWKEERVRREHSQRDWVVVVVVVVVEEVV